MTKASESGIRSLIGARTQETTEQAVVRIIEELSGARYAGGGLFQDPSSGRNLPLNRVVTSIKESSKKRRDGEREVWATLARQSLRIDEIISGLQKIVDLYGLSEQVGKPLTTLKDVFKKIRDVGLLWVEMVDQEKTDRGEAHEQRQAEPEANDSRLDRSVLD